MRSGAELAKQYPCKESAGAEATAFCVGQSRVIVYHPLKTSLTSRISVYEIQGGKRVLDTVILGMGAFIVRGDRLYYWRAFGMWSISVADPGRKPVLLSKCDCGTEGSPYSPALAGERAVCILTGEEDAPKETINGRLHIMEADGPEFGRELCTIPSGKWVYRDHRIVIEAGNHGTSCRDLLGQKILQNPGGTGRVCSAD